MSLSPSDIESLESQAFNLMGRLHVMLRREIGRVTDIKYMAANPEYCAHVLGLASQVSNAQLKEISDRLGEIYFGDNGLFGEPNFRLAKPITYQVLKPKNQQVSRQPNMPVDTPVLHDHTEDIDPAYIGRLR